MDPNANLTEQRALARDILVQLERREQLDPEDVFRDCDRMAELVLALDEWLHRGGFLPARWQHQK